MQIAPVAPTRVVLHRRGPLGAPLIVAVIGVAALFLSLPASGPLALARQLPRRLRATQTPPVRYHHGPAHAQVWSNAPPPPPPSQKCLLRSSTKPRARSLLSAICWINLPGQERAYARARFRKVGRGNLVGVRSRLPARCPPRLGSCRRHPIGLTLDETAEQLGVGCRISRTAPGPAEVDVPEMDHQDGGQRVRG
jgi:hypothetical protein